jgi:dephospho-CoA kinase
MVPGDVAAPGAGLRIGLTGGIGSGKSTVAALLARCGGHVVDTDAIARELTLPAGLAIEPIRAEFGSDFIDAAGALDRARMRELAFADPLAKRRLEAILHPLIGIETERRAAAAAAGATLVFDVPLLVESSRWRALVDKVLVVDCREDTQIERVIARSGWSRPAVQAVLDQQASRSRKRAAADAVIFNDGISLAVLERQVLTLWALWHPVEQSGFGGRTLPARGLEP